MYKWALVLLANTGKAKSQSGGSFMFSFSQQTQFKKYAATQ